MLYLCPSDFEADSVITPIIKSFTFNEFVGKKWKCCLRVAFRPTVNASEAAECSLEVEKTAGLTCSYSLLHFITTWTNTSGLLA